MAIFGLLELEISEIQSLIPFVRVLYLAACIRSLQIITLPLPMTTVLVICQVVLTLWHVISFLQQRQTMEHVFTQVLDVQEI
jgi:hypothetical protein